MSLATESTTHNTLQALPRSQPLKLVQGLLFAERATTSTSDQLNMMDKLNDYQDLEWTPFIFPSSDERLEQVEPTQQREGELHIDISNSAAPVADRVQTPFAASFGQTQSPVTFVPDYTFGATDSRPDDALFSAAPSFDLFNDTSESMPFTPDAMSHVQDLNAPSSQWTTPYV